MKGHEHYLEGEKQLNDAKEQASDGFHDEAAVTAQFAIAHFAAASAAAQAQNAVLSMCGDSTRVTDWGVAIGWDTIERRCPCAEEADYDDTPRRRPIRDVQLPPMSEEARR